MTTAVTERLLTAEDYSRLADPGHPTELVRGRVIEVSRPSTQHGYYAGNISRLLGNYVHENKLGRVVINDSGIVTERGPDTVRGADVAYYSYERLPRGPIPDGYVAVLPELVFEVRSPNDRWPRIYRKVSEYLEAGVSVACVLDPELQVLVVYRPDELNQTLEADDLFTLPALLGDFSVAVREFLE